MNPLLSIIVPVYNSEKYLKKCVESILNQSYKKLELILVNDGSTDSSQAICNYFLSVDQRRVKVIHKENEGPSLARKVGLEYANGEYVTFVDSDDYIQKNMYEKMLSIAIDQNADIIQCGYSRVKEDGELIEKHEMNYEVVKGQYECSLFYAKQKNVTNYLINKVYRKPLFDNVEFKNLFAGEDAFVLAQVFLKTLKVITIPDVYYFYVMSEESLCRSPFTNKKLDTVKAGIYIYEIYKNYYPDLSDYFSLYICSYAAQNYYEVSQTNWSNKRHLKREMIDIFKKYYNPEKLKKCSKDISIKRWGLIKIFNFNPFICNIIIKCIGLMRN